MVDVSLGCISGPPAVQGAAAPLLPLLPEHLMVLDMAEHLFWNKGLPDGVERSLSGEVAAVDPVAYAVWAANSDIGNVGGAALGRAMVALLRLLEIGEDPPFLMASEQELVGPQGEALYLVKVDCEVAPGDWSLEFLRWVLHDMPAQTRYISFEFSRSVCDGQAGPSGGEAWFIHRGGVEVMSTNSWLHEMAERLRFREAAEADEGGRCRDEAFFSAAGACPYCGRGAS